jgi:hypothetical protein
MTEPTIPAPVVRNDRGFLAYAGGSIPTDYGHEISVYESSAASGPHVWLSVGDSPHVDGHTAHLSLRQAILLRAALDQFIQGVPERWECGAEILAHAQAGVDDGEDG